jgi:ATP synthase protein I
VTTPETSPQTTTQSPQPEELDTANLVDSMAEYYELKNNILLGTIIIALVSFILVWVFYSLNTSFNYLLGACVSLVYVNLLAREVEKVGSGKKRIGSTRLAIFAGLMIIATQREQLQVMPIFLGFMTYKASILFYVLPNSLLKGKNKSE